MKKIKFLVLFTIVLFGLTVNAKNIYVAKNGNDTNSGSISSPYLTITKATSVAIAGDIVYIREGVYEEALAPVNSGSAGNPIIFQSYPGEKVVISAMQSLSGWSNVSGSIYKTTIPFSSLGQGNFVMNGKTACDLARWPNKTTTDPFELNTLRNTGGSAGNIITDAYLTHPSIPNIDWTGGTVFFYGDKPGSGWLAWKRSIKNSSGGRVNFNLTTSNGVDWIRTYHAPADLGDFYLEGVMGALDYQNEWFYNESTNELFIQLPGGAVPIDGEVKMRRRDKTIDLKNKKYIEIRNMAVFGGSISLSDDTKWTTNSNTTNNVLYGVSSFYGGHNLGVTDSFSTGIASVIIEGSYNRVEKCEIAFGAATGLKVSGNNHTIKENLIHDFDYIGTYDAPLVIRDINNSKITNNTIFKGGRDAVNYSGKNNEISYNDISKSNLIADDCGLFYTVGNQPGTTIHHNWLHDAASSGTKYKAAGIYLDNDAAGFSVHHNVIWNTEWANIQINWNGTDINIFNNTLWNGSDVMGAWHKDGTAFSNVKVWNNLGSNAKWEPQSDKQNNLVVTSNVFVGSANGNFNLLAGSSPIDQGKEIPGITDGFSGTKPDVGAYEYGGPNWKAGISWEPLYGPAELGCYGLPGEVCTTFLANDTDKDGVTNDKDLCPNTPIGTTVNTDGCTVYSIPANNFIIKVKGETCAISNDGSISITSMESSIPFVGKIKETGAQKNFTSAVEFSDLSAGTYTLCITTTANADYEQCFTLTITEPTKLLVTSKVKNTKNEVQLELSGGSSYRISLNEIVTVTNDSNVTLHLSSGVNTLTIKTDIDCQGVYEEKFNVFDELRIYPNTFSDYFYINFSVENKEPVSIQVYSTNGQLVFDHLETINKQQIKVNTENLNSGLYIIKVNSKSINFQSKLLKL